MKDYSIIDTKYILETLVQQVNGLLAKIKSNELRQYGITIRQLAVLDIVNIIGNKATPTEIATRLLRQPHSISSLLIRMEKQGLVNRVVNPDMRSNVNITLTKKGKQILKESMNLESTSEITSCLSEHELQQLIMSLKKIRSSTLNKLAQANNLSFP